MERVDVAVVGGGPAGSSAGYAAATHGADVVVFEKGVPRSDRDELGPDSTDAAGMLDYWLDLMDVDPTTIPDEVILQELDQADFYGPTEHLTLTETTGSATYDRLGFTFHRARFDDWLRDRAETAGTDYRVGHSVQSVDSTVGATDHRHRLSIQSGDEIEAEYLILADGPQRRITMGALDQFLPDATASTRLSPPNVNHIAYQEHRRIPEDVFVPNSIKFWWGWMPGETAYPWIFPNDDNIARVGLTMPIGLDIDDFDQSAYRLLDPDDDRIPPGGVYIQRLLEELYGDDYDIDTDFPLVPDRGKSDGTESYPISSTHPIESPVDAGIAVTGGAMGGTSAFHEGGDHIAYTTGKIAGRLAANDDLSGYNAEWQSALGDEILRNIVFADLVKDYEPDDWDRAFRIANRLREPTNVGWTLKAGWGGLKLAAAYKWRKRQFRRDGYVQLSEDEYVI